MPSAADNRAKAPARRPSAVPSCPCDCRMTDRLRRPRAGRGPRTVAISSEDRVSVGALVRMLSTPAVSPVSSQTGLSAAARCSCSSQAAAPPSHTCSISGAHVAHRSGQAWAPGMPCMSPKIRACASLWMRVASGPHHNAIGTGEASTSDTAARSADGQSASVPRAVAAQSRSANAAPWVAADATHQPSVSCPVREPAIRTTLPHAAQKIFAGHHRRIRVQYGPNY
jgi:hypothetical protein